MFTVGIIGATGYAGVELVRLLSSHPEVGCMLLSSTSFEGGRIETVYPNLLKRVSAELLAPDSVVAGSDVVFSALPHGVGEKFAALCFERKIPFIDLSADFRFDDDEATFAAWYGKPYEHAELRAHSIYGLPEMNRERIGKALIIANPGCYPTGASLGLYPALKQGLLAEGTVIVDAASGVTGAGRSPSQTTHYPDCTDSMAPYKVGGHRHVPEIARNFSIMAGKPVPMVFTPHLAPMNRGILSTIYAPLASADGGKTSLGAGQVVGSDPSAPRPATKDMEAKAAGLRDRWADFYKDEPFVRVLPYGQTANTRNVRLSNYCDISIHLDQTGTMLIVVTAIDNMIKGAAGQAIQNMNIVMGFGESVGLDAVPAAF